MYSLQVEYSDREKPNYYFYGGRISEEEIESERERRTTPPGTIGESQDVMSENIGQSLNMLSKKHRGFTAGYPKSSVSVFERKDSTNTKISNIAVIRERIALPNGNKHLTSFKKVYDKLFREFKEALVHEYTQMKNSYTIEYEENYVANENEKAKHILEG